MKNFSKLGITFQKRNEIIKLTAITAACIVGLGTILYMADTGAAAVFSLLFT